MRTGKHKLTKRNARRDGAILLDLFIATLIFAACVLAIGQLGSQSLQIARNSAIERLATLKAESVLASETAHGPSSSPKVWKELLQGIPLTIRAKWNQTDQPRLHRITVEVAASSDARVGRNTASLSRLVYVNEVK